MKIELDVDAWAAVTTLVIKSVFGLGEKMEEGLILSVVSHLLLFSDLHNPLKVMTSLPQCQAYQ